MQLVIGKPVYFYDQANQVVRGVLTAIISGKMVMVQTEEGIERLDPNRIVRTEALETA